MTAQTRPNVAYLMNAYPMTSTTFIRREIEALEGLGLNIRRYAVRRWDGPLVDPRDIAEQDRTQYLLSGNLRGLIVASLFVLATNPKGMLRALSTWLRLIRNAGGEYIKHVAYLMQAAYLYRQSKAALIDHIHVHFATNATTVAMLARLMGGPTYSFTVHGPDELLAPVALSFPLKILHASFVVAISTFCRNFLLTYAPGGCEHKIMIARCGLALEEFGDRPAERSKYTLVCVGRLCEQKGQVLIPKAAAALKEEFPELKIILIGDGDTRGTIEAMISRYGLESTIELRGWVENRRVLDEVRGARALLLPSYAEGLPVVIMEALALGTPVISTTIAGIPELVDSECGWLTSPGDERGLVESIRAALQCSDERYEAMSEAGRRRVALLHDRATLAASLYARFENARAQVPGSDQTGKRLALTATDF